MKKTKAIRNVPNQVSILIVDDVEEVRLLLPDGF